METVRPKNNIPITSSIGVNTLLNAEELDVKFTNVDEHLPDISVGPHPEITSLVGVFAIFTDSLGVLLLPLGFSRGPLVPRRGYAPSCFVPVDLIVVLFRARCAGPAITF